VAQGTQQLPEILTTFEGVAGTLRAEQARFGSADAIPTSSIPATTIPWSLVGVGILAIAIGAWMAFTKTRVAAIVAVILGLLLVVVPLALTLPSKASNADVMNDHLRPVYAAQMIDGGTDALSVIGAMGTEMQESMLPALGEQLGMTPEQVQAFLQENLPATAAGMEAMPGGPAALHEDDRGVRGEPRELHHPEGRLVRADRVDADRVRDHDRGPRGARPGAHRAQGARPGLRAHADPREGVRLNGTRRTCTGWGAPWTRRPSPRPGGP